MNPLDFNTARVIFSDCNLDYDRSPDGNITYSAFDPCSLIVSGNPQRIEADTVDKLAARLWAQRGRLLVDARSKLLQRGGDGHGLG